MILHVYSARPWALLSQGLECVAAKLRLDATMLNLLVLNIMLPDLSYDQHADGKEWWVHVKNDDSVQR